ncbi:capsule assembly Wzi family protein [Dyadobacter sp. CY323]|uniref:capsule assembly Wzi family protein n=1 Tax=Dyadobacter sp. CY323 TaxID=2907302 RepID=UPI001F427D30|nr:capsule assembly Wzi family protein [Dyadobacter sp. CY323]MCE6990972.1 capsule assembly Wzi family protein [Dyadobacter sp. CY323]
MRVCLLCFSLCLAFSSYAQDSTVYYNASILVAGATDQTPFWARANQNGSVPLNGNYGLADIGLYKVYNPHNPRIFQWSGGLQGIGSYGKTGNLFLSDAFAAAKIGVVEILAGQKRMVTGLMDTTLTSGSMSVSGNARPFPRLQISIPNYVPLYITNELVSIKFSYSDGYLGASDVNYGSTPRIPKTYFHQKQLYLNFGNKSQRLNVYAGINHQAMWGGELSTFQLYKLKPTKAYWYTIIGKTVDHRKIGNHFGTIDVAGEWKGKNWTWFLYRQNIYETGSLFKVINFSDGLNGFSIKRNRPTPKGSSYLAFHSFLLEVLGTQNQINNSPLSGLILFEKGNYYNSYIYRRGWSYFGTGIGTPLLPASGSTKSDLPRSNAEFSNNNRLWAFHTGITASWLNLKFAFRGTYSRNSGTFVSAYESVKQQGSALLTAEKNLKILKGCSVFSGLSADIGELYPNSYGLQVGFRKNGFLD